MTNKKRVKMELNHVSAPQSKNYCICCFGRLDQGNKIFQFFQKHYNIINESLKFQQCKTCKQYFHAVCAGETFQNQQCQQCRTQPKKNAQCAICAYAVKLNQKEEQWVHVICALTDKQNTELLDIKKLKFNKLINTNINGEKCDHCFQKGKLYTCPNKCQNDINKGHLICFKLKQMEDQDDCITWNFKISLKENSMDNNLEVFCTNCPNHIYCICDKYSSKDSLKCCENCENWFHEDCFGEKGDNDEYPICSNCFDNQIGLQNQKIQIKSVKQICQRELVNIIYCIQKIIEQEKQISYPIKQILNLIPVKVQFETIYQENIHTGQNHVDQKERELLQIQQILYSTNKFEDFQVLFKNSNKENFYSFLKYFYISLTNDSFIQNLQIQQLCEKINNHSELDIFINKEFEVIKRKILNLDHQNLFTINQPQIISTLQNITYKFIKSLINIKNQPLYCSNNQTTTNQERIEELYLIFSKITILGQNKNTEIIQNQIDSIRIIFTDLQKQALVILKDCRLYEEQLDISKKIDFIQTKKHLIREILNQFQIYKADNKIIENQLTNWIVKFSWMDTLFEILQSLSFDENFDHHQYLNQLIQIVEQNNWRQLPLYSQLKFVLDNNFHIDYFIQETFKCSQITNQILQKILQLDSQNIQEFQLTEDYIQIPDKILQFDHNMNYYILQYFYASNKNKNSSTKDLIQILMNTQELQQQFQQLIKDQALDPFQILNLIKQKEYIYCIEIFGLFIYFQYQSNFFSKIQDKLIFNLEFQTEIRNNQQYKILKNKFPFFIQNFEESQLKQERKYIQLEDNKWLGHFQTQKDRIDELIGSFEEKFDQWDELKDLIQQLNEQNVFFSKFDQQVIEKINLKQFKQIKQLFGFEESEEIKETCSQQDFYQEDEVYSDNEEYLDETEHQSMEIEEESESIEMDDQSKSIEQIQIQDEQSNQLINEFKSEFVEQIQIDEEQSIVIIQ